MIKHLTIAAALFAASAAQAGSCFHFKGQVGGAAYAEAADGLWIQKGLPHKLQLTAPSAEATLVCDTDHVAFNLGYAWLGTIHSQGLATTDANYNLATKTVRTPMPLATFVGSGHDQGVMFTIEPHYDFGEVRVGIEGGPYFHKATWTVDATNIVGAIGQTPFSAHVVSQGGWHLGYVLGFSVTYKNVSLSYQFVDNPAKPGDPAPPIWKNTHVLTLGYTF